MTVVVIIVLQNSGGGEGFIYNDEWTMRFKIQISSFERKSSSFYESFCMAAGIKSCGFITRYYIRVEQLFGLQNFRILTMNGACDLFIETQLGVSMGVGFVEL